MPHYWKEKYGTIICFFTTLVLVETVCSWTENFLLSIDYSSIVDRNNLSIGFILQSFFGHVVHALLNLSIFIVVVEILGKKWFVVPIIVLLSFIANFGLSYINYSHLYFDIRAFNWFAYILYSFTLFLISYNLLGKELKTYYSFILFYLLFLAHRIGVYFGISLLTGSLPGFFNAEFYRFLLYSMLFGGVYSFFYKLMNKSKKTLN